MSKTHIRADICDFFAEADLFGLGAGLYPKEYAPNLPLHPFCRCVLLPVFGKSAEGAKYDSAAAQKYMKDLTPLKKKQIFGTDERQAEIQKGGDFIDIYNRKKPKEYKINLNAKKRRDVIKKVEMQEKSDKTKSNRAKGGIVTLPFKQIENEKLAIKIPNIELENLDKNIKSKFDKLNKIKAYGVNISAKKEAERLVKMYINTEILQIKKAGNRLDDITKIGKISNKSITILKENNLPIPNTKNFIISADRIKHIHRYLKDKNNKSPQIYDFVNLPNIMRKSRLYYDKQQKNLQAFYKGSDNNYYYIIIALQNKNKKRPDGSVVTISKTNSENLPTAKSERFIKL